MVTTTIGVDVRSTTEFRGEYDEGFFEKTVGLQLVDQGAHRRIESVTAGSDRGRIPKVIVHVPATEIDFNEANAGFNEVFRKHQALAETVVAVLGGPFGNLGVFRQVEDIQIGGLPSISRFRHRTA
ncbi:MAG: hypothetical protein R3F31_00985 [Verrucomicrobiales bacterium]